ncbi:hypothetical protein [Kribbella sp. NPDC000426]|uniref:hypothetical protein n=1 Tax=Kribbella sp. NPDC000426 TaxID=3154255 RepID=UPI00332265D3
MRYRLPVLETVGEPIEEVGDRVSPRHARDSLVVVVDGDEVPGISVYGLARCGVRRTTVLPLDPWYGAIAVDEFTLRGDAWEIPSWDLPIVIWPTIDEFPATIRTLLAAVIESGCVVAWIGAEGLPFCDPPQLFDPTCMSGGVLAWMTDDGRFECKLDPDAPVPAVPDQTLLMLRRHAGGLADAGS